MTNDKQNINPQEATFTEEFQNINQKQKKSQPVETDVNYRDIAKEKENELIREANFSEETKSSSDDNKEIKTTKKGFWSRLFGN